MAEKILNTRIQLKYDTYENWTTKNPVLKKGEMAIATIAAGNTQKVNSVTPPQVLIKVGDGTTNYNALPFASGMAADVYSWAKAETPVAIDTDTQYKFEVDSTNKDEKKTVYKISKRTWSNGAWSEWAEEFTFEALTPEQINTYVIGQDTDTKDTDTIKGAKLYAADVKTTVIGQDGDLKTAETIYGAKKYADEAANTVKTTVIGTNADLSSAETIYGAKKYTDEAKSAVIGKDSDTATDDTIKGAKKYTDQKISEIPAQTDYSVTIAETTPSDSSSNILKTYTFTQCGEKIGEINLAKDLVVTEGSVGTVTEAEAGTLYPEAKAGDKYIKLVIANQTEPIYVPANSLVDIYTGGKNTEIDVTIDGSNVITAALVDNGVTTSKIKDLNVTTSKINDGAVTEVKIATDAVTTAKIKDLNVTTSKINDGAVTEVKIATNAVTTDKIKDLNVTTAKINDSAVTEGKIATDAVTTDKIKNANVTKAKLEGAVQSSLDAADTAIQTVTYSTGLTATKSGTNVEIGLDDTVTFVFDCGNASGGSLQD